MNQIYQKNLRLLEDINPGIKQKILNTDYSNKIEYISDPFPNIKIDKKTLHSRINPITEAENLIKNINVDKIEETVFLFLGLGMGYHIKLFIERFGNRIKSDHIIVIEKKSIILKLLIENLDASFLKNVTLFLDEEAKTLENYFSSIDLIEFGGYRVIKLPEAVGLASNYYLSIERIFKDILSSKLSDIITRFSFETLWLRNAIKNIPNLLYSSPINSLKGLGQYSSALVVGAGPSLLDQLGIIKPLSEKLFVISVDTSLPVLLKSGIKPDIVVTLDGQFHSLFDFTYLFTNKDINSKMPVLVYDLFAHPGIIKAFKLNSFFTGSLNVLKNGEGNQTYIDNPIIHQIKNRVLNFDSLPCGGSVLTTGLELALYMNFSKVILVGADLSYTSYKTHVNSSPLYSNALILTNRLSTITSKSVEIISKRKIFSLKSIKSKDVLTDYVLVNYKNWIEDQNRYSENIINASEDGVRISNLKYTTLEKILEKLLPAKPKIKKSKKLVSKEVLHEFLSGLRNDMNSLIDLIEKKNFTFENAYKTAPYLYYILLESKKVLGEKNKIENYLYNLAVYLKKIIKKSLYHLNR